MPLAGAGSSNSLRNSELPSNESSAGLRVPGFQGKGMILHCKMTLAELVVGLDSKGGKAKMDFESATRQGRSEQKG